MPSSCYATTTTGRRCGSPHEDGSERVPDPLGHSVVVAERHYLGVHRGIPKGARTLEAAMQIEEALEEVVWAVSEPERSKAGNG